jgi:hypothetical protein
MKSDGTSQNLQGQQVNSKLIQNENRQATVALNTINNESFLEIQDRNIYSNIIEVGKFTNIIRSQG